LEETLGNFAVKVHLGKLSKFLERANSESGKKNVQKLYQ